MLTFAYYFFSVFFLPLSTSFYSILLFSTLILFVNQELIMSEEQPQIPGLGDQQPFGTVDELAVTGFFYESNLFQEPVHGRSTQSYEDNISPTCVLDSGRNIVPPSVASTSLPTLHENATYQPSTTMPNEQFVALSSHTCEREDTGRVSQDDTEEEIDDLFNEYEPKLPVEVLDEPIKDTTSTSVTVSHDNITEQISTISTTEDVQAPEKKFADDIPEPATKKLKRESTPTTQFRLPKVFADPNFFPMVRSINDIENFQFNADGDRPDSKSFVIVWDHVEPPERKAYIATVGAWLADDHNFTNTGSEWSFEIRKLWTIISSRWEDEDACAMDIFPGVTDAYLLQLLRFNAFLRLIGEKVQARAENEETSTGNRDSFDDNSLQRHEDEVQERCEAYETDIHRCDAVDKSDGEVVVDLAHPKDCTAYNSELKVSSTNYDQSLDNCNSKEESLGFSKGVESHRDENIGEDKATNSHNSTTTTAPLTATIEIEHNPTKVDQVKLGVGTRTMTRDKRKAKESVEPRSKVRWFLAVTNIKLSQLIP